jgi:hypothetical protein
MRAGDDVPEALRGIEQQQMTTLANDDIHPGEIFGSEKVANGVSKKQSSP